MAFQLTPVTGSALIDREREIDILTRELLRRNSRLGFSVIGVRRVGKTSLMQEVAARLRRQGLPVIYVSVWEAVPATLDSFLGLLIQRTSEAFRGRLPLPVRVRDTLRLSSEAIREMLARLRLSGEVGQDVSFALSYVRGDEKDAGEALRRVFTLIDRLSREARTKCVLMIDEFPSLPELRVGRRALGPSVLRSLRTIHEGLERTAWVVSGSHLGSVRTALLDEAAPLYRQLLPLEVGPLGTEQVGAFVHHYLPRLRGQEGHDRLREVTGGLPYNLQILGRELSEEGAAKVDRGSVDRAVLGLLAREGEVHFRPYLERMTEGQVRVARAMAWSKARRPSEIAQFARVPLNEVSAYLGGLMDEGIVVRPVRSEYALVDPLFAAWLGT